VIAGPSEALRGAGIYDDVTLFILDRKPGSVVVAGTADGVDVLYQPELDLYIHQAIRIGDAIVVVVTDDQISYSGIYLLDDEGSIATIVEWDSARPHYPEVAAGDAVLWFTNRTAQDTICLTAYDVARGTLSDEVCGQPGQTFGWPTASGPELSYVTWVDSECGQLFHLPARGDEPIQVSGDDCVFHGTALSGLAAWVGHPEPDEAGHVNYFEVPASGTVLDSDQGDIHELGTVVAGSLLVCDGSVVWLHQGSVDRPTELRTWGAEQTINTIYQSPDEGVGFQYATSKPMCSGSGNVYLMRAGWGQGAPDELLVRGDGASWVDVDALLNMSEPTPDSGAFLEALKNSQELATWVASTADGAALSAATTVCEELDATPDSDRYDYMMAREVQSRWQTEFDMDRTELWFFRQIATQHMCEEYYPLTVGD
jgi:hypothetical protein